MRVLRVLRMGPALIPRPGTAAVGTGINRRRGFRGRRGPCRLEGSVLVSFTASVLIMLVRNNRTPVAVAVVVAAAVVGPRLGCDTMGTGTVGFVFVVFVVQPLPFRFAFSVVGAPLPRGGAAGTIAVTVSHDDERRDAGDVVAAVLATILLLPTTVIVAAVAPTSAVHARVRFHCFGFDWGMSECGRKLLMPSVWRNDDEVVEMGGSCIVVCRRSKPASDDGKKKPTTVGLESTRLKKNWTRALF